MAVSYLKSKDDSSTHVMGCCEVGLTDIGKVKQCPLELFLYPHLLPIYSCPVVGEPWKELFPHLLFSPTLNRDPVVKNSLPYAVLVLRDLCLEREGIETKA